MNQESDIQRKLINILKELIVTKIHYLNLEYYEEYYEEYLLGCDDIDEVNTYGDM